MNEIKHNRILVIDNYDSFVCNLTQLLRLNHHDDFDVVLNDEIDFSRLSCYNKILISPGPGIPAQSGNLMKLIDTSLNTHSILGICLGHQALAVSFGARLRKLEHPKHGHASSLQITDCRDVLFNNISNGLIVGRYHSWVVDGSSLPEELIVSSYDEDHNIMSFYHKDLPVHGVQFHPESIISESGIQLFHNWLTEK